MVPPRFWRESSQRYNLIGTKCLNCNKVYFPPRDICPDCRRNSIEKRKEIQLSGLGNILTYTIVHSPLPAFDLQVPYIMAIIELEEGPRVTAQIVNCEIDDVKIGANVKSVFRKIREDGKSGIIHYGYKFELCK